MLTMLFGARVVLKVMIAGLLLMLVGSMLLSW